MKGYCSLVLFNYFDTNRDSDQFQSPFDEVTVPEIRKPRIWYSHLGGIGAAEACLDVIFYQCNLGAAFMALFHFAWQLAQPLQL